MMVLVALGVALLPVTTLDAANQNNPKPVIVENFPNPQQVSGTVSLGGQPIEVTGTVSAIPPVLAPGFLRVRALAAGGPIGGPSITAVPAFRTDVVLKTIDLQLTELSTDFCTVEIVGAPAGHPSGVILTRQFIDDAPAVIFSALTSTIQLGPGIPFEAGEALEIHVEASFGILPPDNCDVNVVLVFEERPMAP